MGDRGLSCTHAGVMPAGQREQGWTPAPWNKRAHVTISSRNPELHDYQREFFDQPRVDSGSGIRVGTAPWQQRHAIHSLHGTVALRLVGSGVNIACHGAESVPYHAPMMPRVRSAGPTRPCRSVRVLIADPSAMVREMIKVVLKHRGCRGVVACNTGFEALRELSRSFRREARRFDLVFVAEHLPGDPAGKVLEQLRRCEAITNEHQGTRHSARVCLLRAPHVHSGPPQYQEEMVDALLPRIPLQRQVTQELKAALSSVKDHDPL